MNKIVLGTLLISLAGATGAFAQSGPRLEQLPEPSAGLLSEDRRGPLLALPSAQLPVALLRTLVRDFVHM